MVIDKYNISNLLSMNSMHNEKIASLMVKDNKLIIEYQDLYKDEDLKYKCDNVRITYKFSTTCECKAFGKKIRFFDFKSFVEEYPYYKYESIKFSVDNFNELTLHLIVSQIKKNKCTKAMWNYIEVSLDVEEVIYMWFNETEDTL